MPRKSRYAALALGAILTCFAPSSVDADRGKAGIDFRYGSLDVNNAFFAFLLGDDNISLVGIDLYANTEITPGLSIGGRLPIAHARFDEDSQTALGNVSLELRYRLRSALHTRSWLDTSLSVATADDDGEGAQVAGAFAAFWIPDPGLYLPNTNTFRLMYRHQWYLRRNSHAVRGFSLDMGVGVQFLSIDDAEDRFRIPLHIAGHMGLSARAEALARFSTFWTTGTRDEEDDFLHVLEAGIRLAGVGQGSLELLAYIPLDDTYRDVLEAWGLTVGFRTAF